MKLIERYQSCKRQYETMGMFGMWFPIPHTRHRIYVWKQADRCGITWDPLKTRPERKARV